jgi:N-6 DNA Methylase
MAQPTEGLVVSIPVLVDAQCMRTLPLEVQRTLLDLCSRVDGRQEGDGPRHIRDLGAFLAGLLDLQPEDFDSGETLPEDLAFYVPEGRQTIRPTLALRKTGPVEEPEISGGPADASTPASRAGSRYLLLLWDLPDGLSLDASETATGLWHYPPTQKFERLLRHTRVPIGLLTNRRAIRLLYAPHGESVGSITFKIDDMASVGGRALLDAFVMLLSSQRLLGAAEDQRLPALLAESRKRQANVTRELAEQVLQAIEALLHGFEAAAERDGGDELEDALQEEGDHLYGGLLTVLLRLVFLLYAESKGLLPVDKPFYAGSLSVYGLFDQLQEDHGAFPDSMSLRFGAWDRLIALFRAVYFGARHGDLHLPARRGQLFNPDEYPFLEGWSRGGSAPVLLAEDRAAVRIPSIDDATVYRVLEKLILFEGQRLSYAALDVEQIGSVYEAVMGYHAHRVYAPAVCLRPERVWVMAREALDQPSGRRAKWIQETAGLPKAQAEKLAGALSSTASEEEALEILDGYGVRKKERARPGRLVLQPGAERRRTSSHYTPRSLTEPIVRKTLEPLLATMGPEPPSDLILSLRICDPAMGSGAFLVEACRFLADQLVAAWTREGRLELIAAAHEDVLNHAKRLVAQKCLYGVDKNPFAVNLAKVSLWLETLAHHLPFTFLDHALRHGDSLVGLSFDQIRGFHWNPEGQHDLATKALQEALDEAIALRQEIQALAESSDPEAPRRKEKLLEDAEDATGKARLIGDLVIGAFFSSTKDKERKRELNRRWTLIQAWLESDLPPSEELLEMQQEIRERVPTFHWMLEFPEVFYAERPDPLEMGKANGAAWLDAFTGNPPFLRGNQISTVLGDSYKDWIFEIEKDVHGNCDLCAHFFLKADTYLGISGAFGLVATNTIAQGDTRSSALKPLISRGLQIFSAVEDVEWPGAAKVYVSVVHIAKGTVTRYVAPRLNEVDVLYINSYLKGKEEPADPLPLQGNKGLFSVGLDPNGKGFFVNQEEYETLIRKDSRNAERIFSFIGGEDFTSDPAQDGSRLIINFGSMAIEEARRWPDLLSIVEQRVKPRREELRPTPIARRLQRYWWRYWADRPGLMSALAGLKRCLLTAQTPKHLVFSFHSTDCVFGNTLIIFPIECGSAFAVLQSRVHSIWARFLSSTLKEDNRYFPSDCFVTFPFPIEDPRAVISHLEDLGEELHGFRVAVMRELQLGLTKLYDLLVDPQCQSAEICALRDLHLLVDKATLSAYGWSDIEVPPYPSPSSPGERIALEKFEDQVIDKLLLLNAQRAEEERRAALSLAQREDGDSTVKRGKKKDKAQEAQMSLIGTDKKD